MKIVKRLDLSLNLENANLTAQGKASRAEGASGIRRLILMVIAIAVIPRMKFLNARNMVVSAHFL